MGMGRAAVGDSGATQDTSDTRNPNSTNIDSAFTKPPNWCSDRERGIERKVDNGVILGKLPRLRSGDIDS